EESFLEQCLNSVKDIVNEMIIVDTGSTDKTKEIAKKFNAKIFDFKWVDDFSAARNESLRHATKDWVLVLDADEVLNKDSNKQIKELVKDKEVDAFWLLQKNYTNKSSTVGFVSEVHKRNNATYAGWYGSFIVRLFRNKKGFEFEGTVHELVEPSIIEKKNGKIAVTNLVLHHYGNADPEIVRRKKEYYLELSKKKVKQNPNAFSYYELGILQRENNDIEGAISSFKKSIDLESGNMAFFELGVAYQQKKDYDMAIKNYTESLRIKENSDAFQNLGICYFKKGDLKKAYRNLVKAILLSPNKHTIYNNLGAVLEKSGNYDDAVQMLEIATKLNPNNVIGFYNLGIALDKKGEFESAINAYEKAVELGHSK
ncbi:MAG: tetratricopeptide repeat protein, partial [Nanoarchaeota archaeon]|nr:tetratricopeptide repeat protein [Nanoarchaeota archaeon]